MQNHCKEHNAPQKSYAWKSYVKDVMEGQWRRVEDLVANVSKMVDRPNDEFKAMNADFKRCVGDNRAQFRKLDASFKVCSF